MTARSDGSTKRASSNRLPARPSHPSANSLALHRDRLHGVIEPIVRSGGYDLEELVVSRAGRRGVLRVIVDGDSGVSLDAIAELSRAISTGLDRAESEAGELSAGEYVLEVGSPGVDRPLTQPRHWRRNLGRLVKVRVDDRQVTGRITAVDADGVVLDVAGAAQEYDYRRMGPGRVQIEFTRLDEADLVDFDDEVDAGDGEDQLDGGDDDEELEDEE